MGFEINCGRAYQKGIPNTLGAGPQLIPLTCGTCNSTGLIQKRVGNGIAHGRHQKIMEIIGNLKSLNEEKRAEEAAERRQRERERKARERKANYERQQRLREEKEKKVRALEDKRQTRIQDCQVEIDVIKSQLKQLQTEGSPATKARFKQNQKRYGTNRSRFNSLCTHYHLGILDGSQANAKAEALIKEAKALSLTLFEVWLQDLRKKEIAQLKKHFNQYLSHYNPRDDHKVDSQMDKLAKIYMAKKLPSDDTGFKPFMKTGVYYSPYARKDKFDLADYLTLTFNDVYKIRNAVWRGSFRYSVFGGEPAPIYNEETKDRDSKFRELQLKQMAFLHSYYLEISTKQAVPYRYKGCSPELQKQRLILEYYQTLNEVGYAHVQGKYVDHLSIDDVLEQFTVEMDLSRPYAFKPTENYRIQTQSLTCHVNKTVTLAELDNAWQTYRKERQSKFFANSPSRETHSTYIAALSPLLSEQGRYLILRHYATDRKNRHRAFKKALDKTFGSCYFNDYSNYYQSAKLT